mmetsp:Transcript_12073/g.24284  ORF Transcript_12073/g.24284 Transcript_12073/m.24284 type:complete len:205 (+) Transcript_12073:50-664(+)
MMSGPPSALRLKSINGLFSKDTVIRCRKGGSSIIGLKTRRTIAETCKFLSPSDALDIFVRRSTTSGSPAQRRSTSTTSASKSSSCKGTALIPQMTGGFLPKENLENFIWPYSALDCILSSITFFKAKQIVEFSAGHNNPKSSCTGLPASHSGEEIQGGNWPSKYRKSSARFRSFTTRTDAANLARFSAVRAVFTRNMLSTTRDV